VFIQPDLNRKWEESTYCFKNLQYQKICSGFLELLNAGIQKAYFTKLTREFLQNLDTNALKNNHNNLPQIYGKILLLEGYVQPLKMGPIGCPETSVTNHQSRLCKITAQKLILPNNSNYLAYFYSPVNRNPIMRFEVLLVAVTKITVLWDVTPRTCKKRICLHHHGRLQGTFIYSDYECMAL